MRNIKLFIKSVFGLSIAALVINGCWGIFTNIFGPKGGWLSALIFTGSMWYVNHYKGMIDNKKGAVSIDMGMAVGLSLIARDMFKHGLTGLESAIPSLICVSIGGILGGTIAGIIQKNKGKGDI